ncbi:hypothetical protein PV04_00733 [Phialophora macrospora]|uniref:Uncharacterized protein n=1 Tax=Phialophora macrospora TaxID=1851006 RepID=A0A0D2GJL4_9EURO|nr:hypothetical protein PV04_00733 [Phialophora macrospora]
MSSVFAWCNLAFRLYGPTGVPCVFCGFLPNRTYTVSGKKLCNTTWVDFSKRLAVDYIVPSITPLSGNKAGYHFYHFATFAFFIIEFQTYFADISESLGFIVPERHFGMMHGMSTA